MNSIRPLRIAGLLAVGLAVCTAAHPAETIETSLKAMFRALDTNDRAAFNAYVPNEQIGFPVQFFDYDWDNKPVVIEGVPAVNKYLDSLFAELAKRKMKVTSTLSNLKSGSRSPELGFAIFDLTQVMSVDGKSETVKFRVTALVAQDAKTGKWRMFHGHSTLVSQAPGP